MAEIGDSRLSLLLDSTPDLIWEVDREFRLRLSNRAFDETIRAAVGRPFAPGDNLVAVDLEPEELEFWRTTYRRVLDDGGTVVETRRALTGTPRWMEYQFGPVAGEGGSVSGVVVVGRDVTRRLEGEAALERSRAELKAIYYNAPVMMAVIDRSRRVLLANPSLTAFTGVPEEELLAGRACGVLGCINAREHPDGCGFGTACSDCALRTAIEDTFETGRTHREVERRLVVDRGAGPVRIVLLGSTALVPTGNGPRLLLCLQDVTARVDAEEEIRRLNAELEQHVAERTAELQGAVRQMETFSYSVSHDLRAPVRAIDGFSAKLERDHGEALDVEGKRLLAVVRRSTHHMGELVDDLLRFFRVGRTDVTAGPVNMAKIVGEALAEVVPEGGRLDVRVGPLPEATGDAALLRVAVQNLLANAVKFSARQERPVIEVGHGPGPEGDAYFVKDNGAGFDPRYADKLFGVFQRLHSESEFGGTGIGLALVKQIVERHGGKVWAEGRPGEGATFRFSLGRPPTTASGSLQRLELPVAST